MATQSAKQHTKPVYAAAAVGDMAVEQIKKLPETATKLRSRMEHEFDDLQGRIKNLDVDQMRGWVMTELDALADRVKGGVDQWRGKARTSGAKRTSGMRGDLDKFRATAQDTASDLAGTARKQFMAATKQAADVYEGLAARGEKVLGNGKATVRSVQTAPSKSGGTSARSTGGSTRSTTTRSTGTRSTSSTRSTSTSARSAGGSTRSTGASARSTKPRAAKATKRTTR
ncbi:MAG: hypothetical protein ACRDT8_25025 [Micromonosporaceae bacterium]